MKWLLIIGISMLVFAFIQHVLTTNIDQSKKKLRKKKIKAYPLNKTFK